jgi:hypothetical protein
MVVFVLFGLLYFHWIVYLHDKILRGAPIVHRTYVSNVSNGISRPNIRISHDKAIQTTHRTVRHDNS